MLLGMANANGMAPPQKLSFKVLEMFGVKPQQHLSACNSRCLVSDATEREDAVAFSGIAY